MIVLQFVLTHIWDKIKKKLYIFYVRKDKTMKKCCNVPMFVERNIIFFYTCYFFGVQMIFFWCAVHIFWCAVQIFWSARKKFWAHSTNFCSKFAAFWCKFLPPHGVSFATWWRRFATLWHGFAASRHEFCRLMACVLPPYVKFLKGSIKVCCIFLGWGGV